MSFKVHKFRISCPLQLSLR